MSEWTNRINNHQRRASKTRKNKEHNLVIQNTVNWWLRSVRTWENPPQHILVIWGIRYLELPLCYINFSLSFNWFTWKMGTIVLPSSLPQRAKWIRKIKTCWKLLLTSEIIFQCYFHLPIILQILKILQFITICHPLEDHVW